MFSGDSINSINGVIDIVTWKPFERDQSILALAQDYADGRLFWAAFSASKASYVFGYIDVGQRTLFTCHTCKLVFVFRTSQVVVSNTLLHENFAVSRSMLKNREIKMHELNSVFSIV